jgi:hypothetical protein
MTLPTKFVAICAGNASFGENTLSAIMRYKKLHSSTIAQVGRNNEPQDFVRRLAQIDC